MIIEIKAKFACDDCGTEFIVDLDPAYEPPKGWSSFDVAEDAIRGGMSYEDGIEDKNRIGPIGCVTDDDRHLCDRCRRVYDSKP